MLSVSRVYLPSDIPVVGCELKPYVELRRPDASVTADDATEFNPIDGHFLRYKWYRIESDRKVAVCSVHPTEQAALQCLGCVKGKIPVARSYHCSPKCFSDAWNYHRILHEQAATATNENANEEEEVSGRIGTAVSTTSTVVNRILPTSQSNPCLSNNTSAWCPAIVTQRGAGETWFEVGRSKTYTPTADDIGHVLKFECTVVDAETKLASRPSSDLLTSRVIPAPTPSPRHMVAVSGSALSGRLLSDGRISAGTFSVLSYNILSDAYATSELYSYCPSWALSWTYRRQNLLREIVGYRADIICLQEVQNNEFEEFFLPELDKHGYKALFKRKTSQQVLGEDLSKVDGCATFWRHDRFSVVKKYEADFKSSTQSITEALVPSAQKKDASNRLVRDDVVLIVVLDFKFSNQGTDKPAKRQLVCVANTHINVHQELKDVKLRQIHSLLEELEKIAIADIPILVCGDFSSVPGSAIHSLIAVGRVDPLHPDLATDPKQILQPVTGLTHQLPLISAYSSFARDGVGPGLEQRRRVDPITNEPLFTKYTRYFIGTHDYIFYSADSLTVVSLLELLDEESLRKDTAVPSPQWSSDHIALLAEFRCKLRTRPRR